MNTGLPTVPLLGPRATIGETWRPGMAPQNRVVKAAVLVSKKSGGTW